MKNKIFLKFLQFSYGSWLGLIIGLFTTILITRILNPVELAKITMFELIFQLLIVFTILGTDQSFIRFFFEEKEEKRGKLFYKTMLTPIVMFFPIFTILLILNKPISIFLFGTVEFNLIVIIGLTLLVQIGFRYSQLTIRMEQKGNAYSILEILQKSLYLIFIMIIFFTFDDGYKALIYSKSSTLFIVTIIAILLSWKYWRFSNLFINNSKHSQRDILKFGLPFSFTVLITWAFESSDKIAIKEWSTFEELGIYAAAMKLVSLIMVLKVTFATFWTPLAYKVYEENAENHEFFRNATNVIAFVMFTVSILTILGKSVIVLILGDEYSVAASIMPFLVFIPMLYTISETTVVGINFSKKIKFHVIIAFIAFTVNIVGNAWLVPIYGAIGASISTAISYIIFFSLRTHISKILYRVQYDLWRIYTMILVILSYAFLNSFVDSTLINILGFIISLMLLFILYGRKLLIIKSLYK